MTADDNASSFDFDAHRQRAVDSYQRIRVSYEAFAQEVQRILRQCLLAADIKVASIDARAKSIESFSEKAGMPLEEDPERPKYTEPLQQITDLAGIRVITFFPRTIAQVGRAIEREFEVIERIDKAAKLWQEGRLGYQSVHYVIRLAKNRSNLGEYVHFKNLAAEIQVRTVLQHAWAEIEHDIQYKAVETIPDAVRRRFISLAGLIEIADREFQAIQDEDQRLRNEARQSVREGKFSGVEITADALRVYLDKRLGADGRMREYSYEHQARVLRHLGFETLAQLEECIAGYDDDQISRILWGTRQGQLSRFEYLLLASMGDHYIERHLWRTEEWWAPFRRRLLQRLRGADVPIRGYAPPPSSGNGPAELRQQGPSIQD